MVRAAAHTQHGVSMPGISGPLLSTFPQKRVATSTIPPVLERDVARVRCLLRLDRLRDNRDVFVRELGRVRLLRGVLHDRLELLLRELAVERADPLPRGGLVAAAGRAGPAADAGLCVRALREHRLGDVEVPLAEAVVLLLRRVGEVALPCGDVPAHIVVGALGEPGLAGLLRVPELQLDVVLLVLLTAAPRPALVRDLGGLLRVELPAREVGEAGPGETAEP